jgi:uncharacterized protein
VNHGVAPISAAHHVGIGLRQPHYEAFFAGFSTNSAPPLGFIEVHSENFFADGGAALSVLHQARKHCAVSLHGVGLGLGSAAGVDTWHLDRLARLAQRIEPTRVSDHACFARGALVLDGPVLHANDLLPVAFTEQSLRIMTSNVLQVQDRLARSLLIENLSSYLTFADDTMTEPEFFTQLCQRTGCSMLLDVNNLMVNALNAASNAASASNEVVDPYVDPFVDPFTSCCEFVNALPRGMVGEIHLAGYCTAGFADATSDVASTIVIDDHGSRVRPAVWALYEHALHRFGAVPTLIEWDTDLPTFEVLMGEAQQAAVLLAQHGKLPQIS